MEIILTVTNQRGISQDLNKDKLCKLMCFLTGGLLLTQSAPKKVGSRSLMVLAYSGKIGENSNTPWWRTYAPQNSLRFWDPSLSKTGVGAVEIHLLNIPIINLLLQI